MSVLMAQEIHFSIYIYVYMLLQKGIHILYVSILHRVTKEGGGIRRTLERKQKPTPNEGREKLKMPLEGKIN